MFSAGDETARVMLRSLGREFHADRGDGDGIHVDAGASKSIFYK